MQRKKFRLTPGGRLVFYTGTHSGALVPFLISVQKKDNLAY